MSLALASPHIRNGELRLSAASAALLGYTVFRTLRPLRYESDELSGLLAILAEVAAVVLGLTATGYWESPLASHC